MGSEPATGLLVWRVLRLVSLPLGPLHLFVGLRRLAGALRAYDDHPLAVDEFLNLVLAGHFPAP